MKGIIVILLSLSQRADGWCKSVHTKKMNFNPGVLIPTFWKGLTGCPDKDFRAGEYLVILN
ncbi:hypothetical protein CYJ36_07445 [Bacillus sp. UMB0893]|nr:hypothetical protein CYJ36_07445 [Bacillus sp. UMB0893]